MAVDVPFPPAAEPDDPAGGRFLVSAPWALLAAAWGAWLGSMVDSAVEAGPASRVGARSSVLRWPCSARRWRSPGRRGTE